MEKKTWSFFSKKSSSNNQSSNNINVDGLNVPVVVGGEEYDEPSELGDDFDDDEFFHYEENEHAHTHDNKNKVHAKQTAVSQRPTQQQLHLSLNQQKSLGVNLKTNSNGSTPRANSGRNSNNRSPATATNSRPTSNRLKINSSEINDEILRQSMDHYQNQLLVSPYDRRQPTLQQEFTQTPQQQGFNQPLPQHYNLSSFSHDYDGGYNNPPSYPSTYPDSQHSSYSNYHNTITHSDNYDAYQPQHQPPAVMPNTYNYNPIQPPVVYESYQEPMDADLQRLLEQGYNYEDAQQILAMETRSNHNYSSQYNYPSNPINTPAESLYNINEVPTTASTSVEDELSIALKLSMEEERSRQLLLRRDPVPLEEKQMIEETNARALQIALQQSFDEYQQTASMPGVSTYSSFKNNYSSFSNSNSVSTRSNFSPYTPNTNTSSSKQAGTASIEELNERALREALQKSVEETQAQIQTQLTLNQMTQQMRLQTPPREQEIRGPVVKTLVKRASYTASNNSTATITTTTTTTTAATAVGRRENVVVSQHTNTQHQYQQQHQQTPNTTDRYIPIRQEPQYTTRAVQQNISYGTPPGYSTATHTAANNVSATQYDYDDDDDEEDVNNHQFSAAAIQAKYELTHGASIESNQFIPPPRQQQYQHNPPVYSARELSPPPPYDL